MGSISSKLINFFNINRKDYTMAGNINYEFYFRNAPESNVYLRQLKSHTVHKLREKGFTHKQIAKKIGSNGHTTSLYMEKQIVNSSYIIRNYEKIIKERIYPIRRHRDRIDWIASRD